MPMKTFYTSRIHICVDASCTVSRRKGGSDQCSKHSRHCLNIRTKSSCLPERHSILDPFRSRFITTACNLGRRPFPAICRVLIPIVTSTALGALRMTYDDWFPAQLGPSCKPTRDKECIEIDMENDLFSIASGVVVIASCLPDGRGRGFSLSSRQRRVGKTEFVGRHGDGTWSKCMNGLARFRCGLCLCDKQLEFSLPARQMVETNFNAQSQSHCPVVQHASRHPIHSPTILVIPL